MTNEPKQTGTATEAGSDSNKKSQILIIILILLLLITIGISIWAIVFRDTTPALAPDYAPQNPEENAEPIVSEKDEGKLPQQDGGGAVGLAYTKTATIDLSERKAKMYFANPKKSNQNFMIQIVIQDTVILQSGVLKPGYQVTSLDLFKNVKLSAGTYEGKYAVYFYEEATGEKAMLNTEIPLTITVKE